MPELPAIPVRYLDRVRALLADGRRRLLGLAGPPGAGKSTVADALQRHFGDGVARVVPMDGFHLANSELARLGRAGRKGAPDTFDSAGYVALLRRLRQPDGEGVVYGPTYRREIEESVAGAVPVPPELQLVITEGNYLLLDDDPSWAGVAGLLDETWYLEVDTDLRLERLIDRHVQFGRSPAEARAWVMQTDEPNARRIEASAHRANCTVRWNTSRHRYEFVSNFT